MLTINIMMTEVESEAYREYLNNHGSKFVVEKTLQAHVNKAKEEVQLEED
jgi:hypothetical protein